MKSISSDHLKIILLLLFIYFAQSVFAAEKCALTNQLTDSSKKIHCLDKFEFSKKKYSNLHKPLESLVRSSNCWSLAIPNEASCKNIIGFSAKWPTYCTDPGIREENKKLALSMCEANGCKCSLVIDANDIINDKLFFSYAMNESDLVALDNPEKEAKENINNKPELKNSQSEKNQSIVNTEKEKQAQQDLQMAQELKAIEETKAKVQQELKAIEETKAKVQQELKLAQEVKAREEASSEARQKAQQELRKSQEAEASAAALAKLKQEEYEKEKQNAAAKARVLEEIKAEAYAKEKAILEAKAKAQADLKAEEIAKKQAEEQAKAQALIDEKNRVAAAKAAEAQAKAQAQIDEKNRVAAAKAATEVAKKNREQEIAEEKRKVAESQKKIEELKTKPLDIENSNLDKPSPKSVPINKAEETIAPDANPGSDLDANTFAKKKGFRGAPFNKIDSSIELLAACVAANVNFLDKSKGTSFDTKGFREWSACTMQKSINNSKYSINFEKWSNYFKNENPAKLQILGDICMRNIIVSYAGGNCYSIDYSN